MFIIFVNYDVWQRAVSSLLQICTTQLQPGIFIIERVFIAYFCQQNRSTTDLDHFTRKTPWTHTIGAAEDISARQFWGPLFAANLPYSASPQLWSQTRSQAAYEFFAYFSMSAQSIKHLIVRGKNYSKVGSWRQPGTEQEAPFDGIIIQ